MNFVIYRRLGQRKAKIQTTELSNLAISAQFCSMGNGKVLSQQNDAKT